MNKIVNAQIEETFLGREEHGILTCYLHLKGNGFGVRLGGRALDRYDKKKKRRAATQEGFELIDRIMTIVDVKKWEDLIGKYVRIEVSEEGFGSKVTKIGNLIKDDWLDFEKFFDKEEENE